MLLLFITNVFRTQICPFDLLAHPLRAHPDQPGFQFLVLAALRDNFPAMDNVDVGAGIRGEWDYRLRLGMGRSGIGG